MQVIAYSDLKPWTREILCPTKPAAGILGLDIFRKYVYDKSGR
jgi:hypothetical protein